jgi:HAD domain in Swiss Army Knife RNA repair proteins
MIIFLDIDGVMVPAKGWKVPELLEDGFPAFSSKASKVLQSLISEDTTIILTTSHKSNYTINEWKDIFKSRGVTIKKIKALHKNVGNLSRKDEIVNWLNTNPISNDFIIIDDDKSLNALPPYLKKKLILTSAYIGLTEEHLLDIQAILKKGLHSA